MRTIATLLIAGCAAAALAGAAKSADGHTLNLQLPDGSVEQISYSGNAAPAVTFVPQSIDTASPFAMMDAISAQMHREMDQMLRQTELLTAEQFGNFDQTPQLTQALLNDAPAAGTSTYQISTFTSKGACTQTMQITAPANGGAQQVVSKTSGDCSGVPALTTPASLQHPAPATDQPAPILTRDTSTPAYLPGPGHKTSLF